MYPLEPQFTHRPTHSEPVPLVWSAPTEHTITGHLLFRSLRPIEQSEIEAFYAGELKDVVTVFPLDATTHGVLDDMGAEDAWFLLVALLQDGDIIEVPLDDDPTDTETLPRLSTLRVQHRSHTHSCSPKMVSTNIYRDLPALIYRSDTPEDVMRLTSIRAGLKRRFDGKPSD